MGHGGCRRSTCSMVRLRSTCKMLVSLRHLRNGIWASGSLINFYDTLCQIFRYRVGSIFYQIFVYRVQSNFVKYFRLR